MSSRRTKESQKCYREKIKEKNNRNASIVDYVSKHYPWVIEAYEIQKEAEKKVIISSGVFSFYSTYLQNIPFFSPSFITKFQSH